MPCPSVWTEQVAEGESRVVRYDGCDWSRLRDTCGWAVIFSGKVRL